MKSKAKLKCKICGEEGDCGGTIPECANCWEVERRLEKYCQTAKGRYFVRHMLKKCTPK